MTIKLRRNESGQKRLVVVEKEVDLMNLRDNVRSVVADFISRDTKLKLDSNEVISQIYAFQVEANRTSANYEKFKRLCIESKIRLPDEGDPEFKATLRMMIGGIVKQTDSRWRAALQWAARMKVPPRDFLKMIKKDSMVQWAINWASYTRPERQKRREKQNTELMSNTQELFKAERITFDDLKEGSEAILVQKTDNKLVMFRLRYLNSSELKRLLPKDGNTTTTR